MDENVLPYPPAEDESPIESIEPNPDNPGWGVLGGFGVWFASIIVLFLASAVGAGIYLVRYKSQGNVIPLEAEELNKILLSEGSILIQMAMNVGAHLATIAICWMVVTRMGKRSFAEGIGWRWEGQTKVAKLAIIVGISLLFIVVVGNLPRLIPDSKTNPFTEMLKVSQSVRYAVAFLAIFTAPLTEELVYRGLLYSPLKRAIGTVGAVAVATILFAVVHVPQYLGAWGSLTGLLLLSLALTCIRAKTKSIFPCVWIHTLFNTVGAIAIVLGKD